MEFQKEIPTTENRTRVIAEGDFLAQYGNLVLVKAKTAAESLK